MPALKTRRAARERLLRPLQVEVGRRIPADESIPIKGSTFLDFQNMAVKACNEFYTVLPEKCVALSGQAQSVSSPGRCRHCSSPRVRQIDPGKPTKVRTPGGGWWC